MGNTSSTDVYIDRLYFSTNELLNSSIKRMISLGPDRVLVGKDGRLSSMFVWTVWVHLGKDGLLDLRMHKSYRNISEKMFGNPTG